MDKKQKPDEVIIHVRAYGGTHIARAQGLNITASSTSDYIAAAQVCAEKVYGVDKFTLKKDEKRADAWIARPKEETRTKHDCDQDYYEAAKQWYEETPEYEIKAGGKFGLRTIAMLSKFLNVDYEKAAQLFDRIIDEKAGIVPEEKENKTVNKKEKKMIKKSPPLGIKSLKLSEIRIDGKTQSRVKIHDDVVEEYAEIMKKFNDSPKPKWLFPPIDVFHDGAEYWLADGFHRYFGAKTAGLDTISCDIHSGTKKDARWCSVGSNAGHGIRRSNEDKRNAVTMALEDHPEMSDNAIADHVGVSHTFVSEMRRSLATVASENERTYTTKHGTQAVMNTANIGKKYPPPPPSQPKKDTMACERTLTDASSNCDFQESGEVVGCCQCEDGCNGRQAEFGNAKGCEREVACSAECPRYKGNPVDHPAKPKEPQVPRDKVGRRIPEDLKPVWERRQEALGLLSEVSAVRTAIQRAEENKDKLFAEVNFSNVRAHLDQAYTALKVAVPYAVCPYCQGIGCKCCCMRGMVSKYRWEKVCAEEFKKAVIKEVKKELGDRYNEVAGLSDEGV